eukprot:TRINITY_DN23929_c0_g1_i1.p1 TRINITY_DN23929_c0_g1~~TRINITY_DN23929_c0_g1_i1.p1  ORF type:complete len:468 (+),score=155.89 TRINITY_DN23929_c0_g1_i1:51-1406(+)
MHHRVMRLPLRPAGSRARRCVASAASPGGVLSVEEVLGLASRFSSAAPPRPVPTPQPPPQPVGRAAAPAVPLGSAGGRINGGNSYCAPPPVKLTEAEAESALAGVRQIGTAGARKVLSWARAMHASEEDQCELRDRVVNALVLDPASHTHVAPSLMATFGFAPKPHVPAPPGQQECPDLLPGLTGRCRWDPLTTGIDVELAKRAAGYSLRGMRELFKATVGDAVHDRVRAGERVQDQGDLMANMGFTPYINPCDVSTTAKGRWDVLYINDVGTAEAKILSNVPPHVREPLKEAGRLAGLAVPRPVGHCVLSVLGTSTRITPHNGPNNRKLRLYLPIVGPPGDESCLEVCGEPLPTSPGNLWVFDDSFHHVAWNNSPTTVRLVMMWDFWHPDLTDEEAGLLSHMQRLHDSTVYRNAGVETGPELHQVMQKKHFEEQAALQDALRQLKQLTGH